MVTDNDVQAKDLVSKGETKSARAPQTKVEPQPDSEPQLETNPGVAGLLKTPLGDRFFAGLVKARKAPASSSPRLLFRRIRTVKTQGRPTPACGSSPI
jgi:hypothetical protein